MKLLLLNVLAITAAVAFGLRPDLESPTLAWGILGGTYFGCAVVALHYLRQQGSLGSLLAFRRGDPSLGIMLGLSLLAFAWLLRGQLLPPTSPGRAWLVNIYWLIGDVEDRWSRLVFPLFLLALAAAEELVWRGHVLHDLAARIGPRRAMPLAALLYAFAQSPTLLTLRDPVVGLNPVLVLAAFGCGLVWNYLTLRLKRLWPAFLCHAVVSYFGATWFLPTTGRF